jgi:DNA-binding transcriptional LysR family regulator
MDRLDAMTAFVLAADAGGLSAAARKLGLSPAAVTRAVASLEQHVGAELLRRTTRRVTLTEAGERYLGVCRRVLAEIAEAEQAAKTGASALKGTLTVTAPAAFGARHVRPILDEYLGAHPDVRGRLLLLDRVVDLLEEGVDAAVRIASMPDSSLVATKVGFVRRVVCASPAYCERRGRPTDPSNLSRHACVAFTPVTPGETWTFAKGPSGKGARHVKVRPYLTVNHAEAAIGSALEGHGIACVLSYQVSRELADGRLVRLLADFEPDPVPVYLVQPAGSVAIARVRAFVELAVPRLREMLAMRAVVLQGRDLQERRQAREEA